LRTGTNVVKNSEMLLFKAAEKGDAFVKEYSFGGRRWRGSIEVV
jgi:hypothetical protein